MRCFECGSARVNYFKKVDGELRGFCRPCGLGQDTCEHRNRCESFSSARTVNTQGRWLSVCTDCHLVFDEMGHLLPLAHAEKIGDTWYVAEAGHLSPH